MSLALVTEMKFFVLKVLLELLSFCVIYTRENYSYLSYAQGKYFFFLICLMHIVLLHFRRLSADPQKHTEML